MPGSTPASGPVCDDGNDGFIAEGSTHYNKTSCYRPRIEIEENSPSLKDGIDTAKEYCLRKSYCSFLKDLGLRLRMPDVVIATSTVFCHRFYLHQSHHKNDRYTIATACMFLAGKVEEARRALDDVVCASFCLQNRNNPSVASEIKKKDVCEKQKELVFLAEKLVLITLDFNLKVWHPQSFVLASTLKQKVAHDLLIKVSCIFLNDALYTTLCLQFKPQHIAASALLLAAKLLKFKFPTKTWWKEFDVTLQQMEEICCQILELYERERTPSHDQSSSSCSSDEKMKVLSQNKSINSSKNPANSIQIPPDLSDNMTTSIINSQLTKNSSPHIPVRPKLVLKSLPKSLPKKQ